MGRPGPKSKRLESNKLSFHQRNALASELSALPHDTNLEHEYVSRVPLCHRKRYAQFFTPPDAVRLMTEWITADGGVTVLDPAVGTGLLARSVLTASPHCRLVGYDVDPLALTVAEVGLRPFGSRYQLRQRDFLTCDLSDTYDAAIANPPYLRHHDMRDGAELILRVAARNEIRLSRLTNSYCLFLLEACRRLKPGGRAAFIIPTEWTNANFGHAIKQFLFERGYLRWLIYACNHKTVFDDALTTSSILLLQKGQAPETINALFVPEDKPLPTLQNLSIDSTLESSGVQFQRLRPENLLSQPKWDDLIRRGSREVVPGLVPLRSLAATKRGVATGANEFFHLTKEAVENWCLPEASLRACIGRANDVKGLIFAAEDFEELRQSGRRAYVLNLKPPLNAHEQAYIRYGESKGLHERYLTKVRSPWYISENMDVAPIWAAVFGRRTMRFVVNEAGVNNLTAFHGIYPKARNMPHVLALAAVLNSDLIQDLMRRQIRVYGGGLLKFEPRDLLDILVPDLRLCSSATITRLGEALRLLNSGSEKGRSELEAAVDTAVVEAGAAAKQAPLETPPCQLSLSLP